MPAKAAEERRAYARAHYLANKERYAASARRTMKRVRARNRQHVWHHLNTHPCVDCGEADPVVLQFDHVWGTKEYTVSALLYTGVSIAKIDAEIAKCEVRCANCHMRKTATAQNWYAWLD